MTAVRKETFELSSHKTTAPSSPTFRWWQLFPIRSRKVNPNALDNHSTASPHEVSLQAPPPGVSLSRSANAENSRIFMGITSGQGSSTAQTIDLYSGKRNSLIFVRSLSKYGRRGSQAT